MSSQLAARAFMVLCAGVLSMGAAAAQAKVAIINVQRAIIETAEIKKAQAELEAKFRPRTGEIEKVQKELQDIQARLQSGKVTPQEESDLQMRGQRRQREYQRLTEDLQGDVDRERSDILQSAGQRMNEVVRKIAEAQNADVVIDVSNTVYFKPALDITNEVIKAYDASHPVK
jgi:outer membrane protein